MIWLIIVVAIIVLDQYTKYLAATKLIDIMTYPLIEDVFHFTFVKNKGAAFGILQNRRWFFLLITGFIIVGFLYYLIKNKPTNKLFLLSSSMILGGAIGNYIDRIRLGYVIDFFDFRLINFAVFNVADSFVVVGTALLCYYILFQYEEKKGEV